MDEQQVSPADAVKNLAGDIQDKAADLAQERERELALAAEESRLAAEMEALAARRAEVARQRVELRAREVSDERAILEDARELRGDLGDAQCSAASGGGDEHRPPGRTEFEFFVDDQRYETELPRMTALQIKAKVANWDPSHDLELEGHGSDPNQILANDAVVDFAAAHRPLHFFSVPKANFG